jgi:hypothetical protein
LLSFSVYSEDLTTNEIDEFNKSSDVKIVRTFDPEHVENLVIGSQLNESLTHFFGGRAFRGNFEVTWVNRHGKEIGTHIDNKKKEEEQIPDIRVEGKNVFFDFLVNGDNIAKTWQEALKFQNRKVLSPYDCNPEKTIYLDRSDVNNIAKKDIINFKGDVLKFDKMPKDIQFKKIVVEYLGDNFFESEKNDLEQKILKILNNMKNMLTKDGVI